jgi:hypothetical protein
MMYLYVHSLSVVAAWFPSRPAKVVTFGLLVTFGILVAARVGPSR